MHALGLDFCCFTLSKRAIQLDAKKLIVGCRIRSELIVSSVYLGCISEMGAFKFSQARTRQLLNFPFRLNTISVIGHFATKQVLLSIDNFKA